MLFTLVIFNTYVQLKRVFYLHKICSSTLSFQNYLNYPFKLTVIQIYRKSRKLVSLFSVYNTCSEIIHRVRILFNLTFSCFVTYSVNQPQSQVKAIKVTNGQQGMTLIEVMVALIILVTAILGAVALQATAKQSSFDAMQRSIASSLAQDIVERMRSNDSSNDSSVLANYEGTYGNSAVSNPPTCNANNSLCTSAQIATLDLFEWEQSLMGADVMKETSKAGGLVGASACIVHENNAMTVVISWQGRTKIKDGATLNSTFAKNCGTTGDRRRQVVVNAFIY
jgi:type IV pilus assembly protein PilV